MVIGEVLLIACIVLASLYLSHFAFQLILRKYYEAFYSVAVNDYVRFKTDFGHLYLVLFLLLRLVLPAMGVYFLLKKAVAWLRTKENFLASYLKNLAKRIKRSGAAKPLLHSAVIFVALLAAEKFLRLQGYNPGSYYKEFRLVNKLQDCNFQFTDSSGIVKIKPGNKFIPPFFGKVNHEGFRSRYEFDSASIAGLRNKGEKLVMFIGDSYTEGSSAFPRDSCFADLIDKNPGFHALNFGIGGTDPLQYRLVAQRYIPVVKPDAVVIVSCSNDIMQYNRKPIPNAPLHFFTNAAPRGTGWDAQKPIGRGYRPNDILKTPEEAYEFYKEEYALPQNSFWGRLCSKSVFTTLIWAKLNHPKSEPAPNTMRLDLPYTYNHLKAIQQLCDNQHIPALFFYIPRVDEISEPVDQLSKQYAMTFRGLPVHHISGLTASDHVSQTGDTHLNNRGHAKFAAYIASVLHGVFASN